MQIGIGVTTRNRKSVFEYSYSQILKFAPENAKIVVVDDASDTPVAKANYRFEINVGIARAKNKCFELLEACDYIFLFDDDTFPIKIGWHEPYINSGLNHAMMIFDKLHDGKQNGNRILLNYPNYKVYSNPCGCMLFYTKKCLQAVGGMDVEYGIWGHEHVDLSVRINNAGLTPHKFMDVQNSLSLFYAHDYHETVERSVSAKVRAEHIKRNESKYRALGKSAHYVPYKEVPGRIITTYFNGYIDPQRGGKWDCKPEDTYSMVNSIRENSRASISIISDCLKSFNPETRVNIIEDECTINPYLQRWLSIFNHLKEIDEEYVFCVDATDVEMLKNPFIEYLGDRIFVGDEPGTIKNDWLIKHHNVPLFKEFFKINTYKPLLNAGVIGGRKEIIIKVLETMAKYISTTDVGMTDMALFNYVLYTHFADKVYHGRRVTTVFKAYTTKGGSWFKHK